MKVLSLTDETRLTGSYAATIGFFDGVHRGHRYVVEQLRRLADARGWPSMVITFDRHPRQVVQTDWHPLLLTTLDEKIRLLATTGIDLLVVLPFDGQMASLSAREFMQRVLVNQLGVRLLLTGYDNRFGHRTADTSEGFADYVRYGNSMGLEVVCGEGLQTSDLKTHNSKLITQTSGLRPYISSSLIRRLLEEGRVAEAAQCLGRDYSLSGTVVHGFQQGRTMGFPTANMLLADDCQRLVPKDGVYAVRVCLTPHTSHLTPLPAITNIGMRPTFDGHRRTIETYIFDFTGDLYGQTITVLFVDRLRNEQHFASPQDLARQMADDEKAARSRLASSPTT